MFFTKKTKSLQILRVYVLPAIIFVKKIVQTFVKFVLKKKMTKVHEIDI